MYAVNIYFEEWVFSESRDWNPLEINVNDQRFTKTSTGPKGQAQVTIQGSTPSCLVDSTDGKEEEGSSSRKPNKENRFVNFTGYDA